MSTLALILVIALCSKSVNSQQLVADTDPPTTDESPAIIAAPENATNVTMYCVVASVDLGIRQNLWRITRPGVICVFTENEALVMTELVSLSVASPNQMHYTVSLTLPPGRYRFSVTAGNAFSSSGKSDMFPTTPGVGVEGENS